MRGLLCFFMPLALAPLSPVALAAQRSSGPRAGTLILTGGEFPAAVRERFVALAGGSDAEIVYVPTAASALKLESGFIYEPPDSDGVGAGATRAFEAELAKLFGVRRVTVLHTRNRATANSRDFSRPLRRVRGVWLSSGNSGRLASAYLGTRVQRELEALLERGGVVGGNSAGAIIQGSYIVRGRPDKPLLMAKGHEAGFGFLTNVAVNPHLISAKRENELVDVVDAHPELLGVGLADSAAVIVNGDRMEVIGDGRVAIYDDEKHGCCWYYWLPRGAVFDLRARKVISTSDSAAVR